MSNYTKSTNFLAKDSLPSGNAGKVIKGSEIDTEYNNIATSIATKADLNSPTFTGTPAAPTAALGTSTTQLATTAYVRGEINALGNMSLQNKTAVDITGGTIVGITDLAVADGGTGRSALTANNLLLGNGTSGVNFVAPSTSGNLLESNGTTWSSVANKYVGVSQTWQSFTGSRALGTSYQNTTGKPIMASLSISGGSSSAVATVQVSTDNVTWVSVATMRAQSDQDVNGDSFSWIIPNGHYYKAIVTANSPSIVTWAELR